MNALSGSVQAISLVRLCRIMWTSLTKHSEGDLNNGNAPTPLQHYRRGTLRRSAIASSCQRCLTLVSCLALRTASPNLQLGPQTLQSPEFWGAEGIIFGSGHASLLFLLSPGKPPLRHRIGHSLTSCIFALDLTFFFLLFYFWPTVQHAGNYSCYLHVFLVRVWLAFRHICATNFCKQYYIKLNLTSAQCKSWLWEPSLLCSDARPLYRSTQTICKTNPCTGISGLFDYSQSQFYDCRSLQPGCLSVPTLVLAAEDLFLRSFAVSVPSAW